MSAARLFVALPLPPDTRRDLARAAAELAVGLPARQARVVPEENLHVTLRFFGDAAPAEVLAEALREALPAFPAPLRLRPAGFGAFPSLRRARVLYAALPGEDPGAIDALQGAAERVARMVGLPDESRPFVPHGTLLRLRRPACLSPALLAAAEAHAPTASFTVDEAHLIASALRPSGPEYRVVSRFPLSPRPSRPPE